MRKPKRRGRLTCAIVARPWAAAVVAVAGRRMVALAGAVVATAALAAPALAQEPTIDQGLSQSYSTPGVYVAEAPPYAYAVKVLVQGGSGANGSSSALGTNPGGAGGLGSTVAAQYTVAPGDLLEAIVGQEGAGPELGGGGQGGLGDGTAGSGGSGGGASAVALLPGASTVPLAVGGGGGGGGGGGAFFNQAGGAGGGGNRVAGADGSGAGAGRGGGGGPIAEGCSPLDVGASALSAGALSDAGGGGGGGGGFCSGAGGSGGAGGGGGGGGGAGGSAATSGFSPTFGLAAAPGNGLITLQFLQAPTAPAITSLGSASVLSTSRAFSYLVTATGFPGPALALSGAPSWLSLGGASTDPRTGTTSALLSGTIPARLVGQFTFTITAADGTAPDAAQRFTLDVTAPPLTFVDPGAAQGAITGNVSNPFTTTLSVWGGIPPYTWSSTGTLPPGLKLSPTGQITGTPTQAGTFNFTAKATDSEQPAAVSKTEQVTITIAPRRLTITTGALPSGKVGVAYSQPLVAAMGLAPLKWRIASGQLPSGLTLASRTGLISGTPTALGHNSFTVRVTDSSGMTATAGFTIVVSPNVQAAVYVTEGGYSGVQSFPLGATGDIPPTTSITGPKTGLDGTAAAVIDPVTGTLYIASAGSPAIAEYPYGATGNVAPTAVIAGGLTGLAYPTGLGLDGGGRLYVADHAANAIRVFAPGATGNVRPDAVISGADTGLVGPAGVTVDPTGHVWVANAGANSITEYAAGASGDAKPLVTIVGTDTKLDGPTAIALDGADTLLVANLLGGTVTAYPTTASDDAAPSRTIPGQRLPDGVDVDSHGNIFIASEFDGVREYGPDAGLPGSADTAIATLAGTHTGISSPTGVAVAPPLALRTHSLPAARVGRRYARRLRAVLGTTPYRWSVVSGRLPAGLHLRRDGQLSGRPRRPGVYRFTVRVRDTSGPGMTARGVVVLRVRR